MALGKFLASQASKGGKISEELLKTLGMKMAGGTMGGANDLALLAISQAKKNPRLAQALLAAAEGGGKAGSLMKKNPKTAAGLGLGAGAGAIGAGGYGLSEALDDDE